MKEKEIIIGIDVSKANLDVCILVNQASESHRIKNDIKHIRAFLNKLKGNTKILKLQSAWKILVIIIGLVIM